MRSLKRVRCHIIDIFVQVSLRTISVYLFFCFFWGHFGDDECVTMICNFGRVVFPRCFFIAKFNIRQRSSLFV